MSDLLRLRAMTVVDHGSDGETADFRWLLSVVASEGKVLPALDEDGAGDLPVPVPVRRNNEAVQGCGS